MKMASPSQPVVHDALSSFKSKVWVHFGFHQKANSKDLDMQYAICKECHMKIKYCGNMTNLRAHLTRYHLELAAPEEVKRPKVVVLPPNQRTLDQTKMIKLPPNSKIAKKITESIAFISKDLQPYSVVENEGFQNLLSILEPRYVIPSRKYFTDTAIPNSTAKSKRR